MFFFVFPLVRHCSNALVPLFDAALYRLWHKCNCYGAEHIAICSNCVPVMIVMKMNALFLSHNELDNTTNTDAQHCIIMSRLAALEVFCLPFNWNEDDYGVMVYFSFHVMRLQRSWLIAVIVSFAVVEFCCYFSCMHECEWHIVWQLEIQTNSLKPFGKTAKWAASHRNLCMWFSSRFRLKEEWIHFYLFVCYGIAMMRWFSYNMMRESEKKISSVCYSIICWSRWFLLFLFLFSLSYLCCVFSLHFFASVHIQIFPFSHVKAFNIFSCCFFPLRIVSTNAQCISTRIH